MKKTILTLIVLLLPYVLQGQSDANIRNLHLENSAGTSVTLQPGSVTSGPDLQIMWPASTPGAAIYDSQDNQHNLGLATQRWGDVFANRYVVGGTGSNFSPSRITSGSGAPSSTCDSTTRSSIYLRTDGLANATAYICDSAGWEALISSSGGSAPGGPLHSIQSNNPLGTFFGSPGLIWSDPANTLQIVSSTGLGGLQLWINLAIAWNDVSGTQVNLMRVDGNNNFQLGFIQVPAGVTTCGAPPGFGCGSTIFFQNGVSQLSLNNVGFENLSPTATGGAVDLGSASFPFRAANLQAINMRGTGTFGAVNYIDSGGGEAQLTGVSVPGGSVTYLASGLSSFIPAFDLTFDLGTTATITRRWRNIYGQNLILTGTCTGCPGSTPIGPNGAIQFNNSGVPGGDSALIWDVNSKSLNLSYPGGGPAIIELGTSGHGYNGLICLANSTYSSTGCLAGGSVTTNGDILFTSGSSAGFAPDFDANKNLGLGTRRWQTAYIVQLDLGGDGSSTSNTVFLTGVSGTFKVQTPLGNSLSFSNGGQLSFPGNPNTVIAGSTSLSSTVGCPGGQHISGWNVIGGWVISFTCS